jgi:adenine/guanine phosphoribosyltransferase-like PRPP-binding protein
VSEEDHVSDAEIWQLLERGGLRAEMPATNGSPDGEAAALRRVRKYNGLQDPSGAERLGVLLAERARGVRPDLVVVWEDVEDAILAFIVGRELGIPVIRVVNADGLAESTREFPPHSRAVLVGDVFTSVQTVGAVDALLDQHGGKLATVVSLVDVGTPGLPVAVEALVAVEVEGVGDQ